MEQILRVELLNVSASRPNGGRQSIIQEITFDIHEGETLALVGESGSGKSVTAGSIAGMLPNALRIESGRIYFRGEEVNTWPQKKRKQLRGKEIGWVFQDHQGSFTPFIRTGSQFVEILRTHNRMTRNEAKKIALSWLERVELPAERVFSSYPFQLSGGQRQRIALAAALMLQPSLLIADEPTSALDVLTGEKIMDLMAKLQRQTNCAILLISHDLRQVLKRANRIAVMQKGRVIEIAETELIRDRPRHPYTRILLNACPRLTGPLDQQVK